MGAVDVDSAAGRTGPQILRLAAGAGTFLLIAGLLYFAWAEVRCARAVLAYPFGWTMAKELSGSRRY